MIRVVLAGWADDDWRPYRQPQWMAQVRQSPEAARLPRVHFDIAEAAYEAALAAWDGTRRESAVAALTSRGAMEILRG